MFQEHDYHKWIAASSRNKFSLYDIQEAQGFEEDKKSVIDLIAFYMQSLNTAFVFTKKTVKWIFFYPVKNNFENKIFVKTEHSFNIDKNINSIQKIN